MGKSKSSGSSELDPAIRGMMQETFDLVNQLLLKEFLF